MGLLKNIERSARKKIPSILGFFLKNPKPPLERDRIERILVIRQDERIGNMLLTTPAISILRDRFPNSQIDALISEKFARFWQIPRIIDNFFYINKKSFIKNPFALFGLLNRLKKRAYDLVIDLSSADSISINSMIYTYFSGGRWRLGYKRKGSETFLNIEVKKESNDLHETEILAGLLRPVCNWDNLPDMTFTPTNSEKKSADDYKILEKTIGINLGGRGRKRWPHFVELGERLAERWPVILFGGPAEHRELWDYTPPDNMRIFPLSRLGETGAAIAQLSLFVTADTGLLHLASACKTSTIAIFQIENHRRYNPIGQKYFYPAPSLDELHEYIKEYMREET